MKLYQAGVRVQLHNKDYVSDLINVSPSVVEKETNETVGKKIREAEMQKIPYMLVIGDKEVAAGTVAVRTLADRDIKAEKLDKFVSRIVAEISERV